MIEVRNITKSYGSKKVLDNVSVKLEKGTFNMIVGGNGAGKSTLINIIGNSLEKDSGEVLLDGRHVENYAREDRAKKISLLKQDNNISLNLTVRDLVSFGRFPYNKGRLTREDESIIVDSMEKTETLEFADRLINNLSGGQRQRAFLAMILAQQTEIILLDEPLASLDLRHSVEFVNLLKEICIKEEKTVVMIVHDLNVASMAADTIIGLKNGRLQACGCVNDVIETQCLFDIFGVDFAVEHIENRPICFVK